MGVKYVKDFEFSYMNKDSKVPKAAKASSKDVPARAKPNAPARGAPKMESKPKVGKGQGFAEGGRVPGYEMDRLPTKKPPGLGMDLAPSKPFKGEYQGYAKGGMTKGEKKVGKVMREYKEGKLHSGSKKGPKVESRKQAIAIALSEARKAGAKIPKKAMGGIFNDEDMAYESKGPKTRYSAARSRRMSKERAMERRALDKARHAEKYAPGLSLDMADRKAHGGMMKGEKFPDLTGDGKVTRADVLKGRGVFKNGGMPTHRRKPMYGGGKC